MQVIPSCRDKRYLNIRSSKLTNEQMVKHRRDGARVGIMRLHERMNQWDRRNVRRRNADVKSMRAEDADGMDVVAMPGSMPRRTPLSRCQVHCWRQLRRRQGACVKEQVQEPRLVP